MQREQFEALRGEPPPFLGEEIQENRLRRVCDVREVGDMRGPFVQRNFQGFLVHLAVVVDDRERDATFEIGESEARALFRRIEVAVLDRPARCSVAPADHAIELAEQALDHAAFMHAASVAASNEHAIIFAAAPERGPPELFRRIRHDLLGAAEGWPVVRHPTRLEPGLLAADGVGEA